jgi:MFS family permease
MAWFREGERGFAMSVRQMALPAGGALGALILPTIAEHLGFQAVYGVLAAFCFITTIFAWFWLHEPPLRAPMAAASALPLGAAPARSPFRNGQVWRMVCGLAALCVPQIAVVTFAAVFLNDVCHLSTAAISGIVVLFQIGAAFTRVWGGRFTDRHRNRRPFLKGCALATAGIFAALALDVLLMSSSSDHGGAANALAVMLLIAGGTAASTWHGIAYAELATIAGMKHVGTALGLGNTFVFGVYFLTPLSIPVILSLSAWPGVWLAAAAAALVAFVLFPKPVM